MSVRRPARGWQAALEIKYAVASQDSRDRDLNEDEIGPVKVATTVMSIPLGQIGIFTQSKVKLYQVLQERLPPIRYTKLRAIALCLAPHPQPLAGVDRPREASAPILVLVHHFPPVRAA